LISLGVDPALKMDAMSEPAPGTTLDTSERITIELGNKIWPDLSAGISRRGSTRTVTETDLLASLQLLDNLAHILEPKWNLLPFQR
jgi:hypothetical protein